MSSSSDRGISQSSRSWDREMEILEIVERNRRIATIMAEAARLRGGGAALEAAKREFWARSAQHLQPVPGQRSDSPMTDVVIVKGNKMHLAAGDIEGAAKLAKREGISLKKAIEIYSEINKINQPSYLGGDLLEKDVVKKSSKKAIAKAVRFAVDHQMTGKDPEVDRLVFKALYAANRPAAAAGDAEMIQFLRHGRP